MIQDMKHLITICLFSFLIALPLYAQNERKMVREGVKEFNNDKFSEAEVKFRKALDEKPGLYEAKYDIANSLYKQKKYEEAATEFEQLIQQNDDPEKRADLFHNLGNANLMAQQYDKGVEAYKNSLRLRPGDENTRYNLAYAQSKLKEQQKQKQDNKNSDNKDKDQQNKDSKEQDQQNKDKQDQQQNKEQQDKKDQKEQQDQQNPKEDNKSEQKEKTGQKMNKQEAEQMLNAIQNQEKEVKAKVDKKKAIARPVRSEKDW
jgi:Tfp pilus assembly protein PilF